MYLAKVYVNFCLQLYIYWDHVTLRLHTGALYLTNYVTSEGNWLHDILFRGFIAKAWILMHASLVRLFLLFILFYYSYYFHFISPILTILRISIRWNPNKNQFKLQGVMQQNWKNAKGMNTFSRHSIGI